jgi:hypothetical protein
MDDGDRATPGTAVTVVRIPGEVETLGSEEACMEQDRHDARDGLPSPVVGLGPAVLPRRCLLARAHRATSLVTVYTLREPVARRVTEDDVPLASHRLDLVVVPDDPEDRRSVATLLALGDARGWWSQGAPGPEAAALGVGAFAGLRVEEHPAPRLFANGLGGFRVRCGSCEAPLARALGRAMVAARGVAVPVVPCAACGVSHSAAELDFAPAAAFACVALTLVDVERPSLSADASAAIAGAWGPWRLIARRVG